VVARSIQLMSNSDSQQIFRYWGKAQPSGPDGPQYHLLPYHCLDVATVADAWWKQDAPLRRSFVTACHSDEQTIRAWLLFFVSMHDLGKCDVRFQLKAKEVALRLNPLFSEADSGQTRSFDHGQAGYAWFNKEYQSYVLDSVLRRAILPARNPLLRRSGIDPGHHEVWSRCGNYQTKFVA